MFSSVSPISSFVIVLALPAFSSGSITFLALSVFAREGSLLFFSWTQVGKKDFFISVIAITALAVLGIKVLLANILPALLSDLGESSDLGERVREAILSLRIDFT